MHPFGAQLQTHAHTHSVGRNLLALRATRPGARPPISRNVRDHLSCACISTHSRMHTAHQDRLFRPRNMQPAHVMQCDALWSGERRPRPRKRVCFVVVASGQYNALQGHAGLHIRRCVVSVAEENVISFVVVVCVCAA